MRHADRMQDRATSSQARRQRDTYQRPPIAEWKIHFMVRIFLICRATVMPVSEGDSACLSRSTLADVTNENHAHSSLRAGSIHAEQRASAARAHKAFATRSCRSLHSDYSLRAPASVGKEVFVGAGLEEQAAAARCASRSC